ncbi:MAG: 50S ribosomal protein L28 [Clostridia bacterium]|nr:50S ribosomal protein L28 [Clostridia bacterium]
MAKCEICNKATTFGIQVSHSHRRSNRTWKPNIKKVRAIVDGAPRRITVCSKCLKSGRVIRAI